MYQLDAAEFYRATAVITQAISIVRSGGAEIEGHPLGPKATSDMLVNLGNLQRVLEPISLPATKIAMAEFEATFYLTWKMFTEISETLRRELKGAKVFVLGSANASCYEPAQPLFGGEVASNFPSIAYDVEQSGKWLACDLATASAFHSIRCIEAGLRALARCLCIPDPTTGRDRNWAGVLKAIRAEIEVRWPASTGRMSGDAQRFDEIVGSLSGMQNPYRNATMHLDAKYTGPEARHIFEVVKGLMQKIAFRMDENGLPLA